MKKFAALFFVLVYFIFSVGATVHLHYCNGQFVGSSLSDTSQDVCSKCGMEKHGDESNCCKDIKVSLKISDKHFSSAAAEVSGLCSALHQPPFFSLELIKLPPKKFTTYYDYNPPGYPIALFLRNRNLRI